MGILCSLPILLGLAAGAPVLAGDALEVRSIEIENGRPKLVIHCPHSFTNKVEVYSSSADLKTWSVSATNLTALTNNSVTWFDLSGTGLTHRFYIIGTDIDSDSDHAPDSREILLHHTNPHNPDMDDDGALDGEEIYKYGSDPFVGDGDGDGLPDWWEQYYLGGLSQGPGGDPDRDGVNNLMELKLGTRPNAGMAADLEDRLQLRVITPLAEQ